MEVILAKSAGFCFGVKRAVEKVYEQIEKGEPPIYTYGPIIHNEEVVADLERRGVKVIEEEHLEDVQAGTVIIRSHGVSRRVQEQMEQQGLNVVDATCPFVKKIHRIVEEATLAGRRVIIIGNHSHPEVQGIMGWCRIPPLVVENEADLESLPAPSAGDPVGRKEAGPASSAGTMAGGNAPAGTHSVPEYTIVSQTTFNHKKFQELVEKISEKGYNTLVVNTICNATQERQTEAREIAGKVEAMIVIGGRHSSNTQKLYDICRGVCPNTYYIQTLVDLEAQCFAPVRSVGITAGASTPNNIIEEVVTHVRSK